MISASEENLERARLRAADEQLSVVVVDGDESAGRALELALRREGFRSASFTALDAALAWSGGAVDVVVTEVAASGLTGSGLLRSIRERLGPVEVVITSGPATAQAAVDAVAGGAYDVVQRPIEDLERVLRVVRRAGERRRLIDRNRSLEAQVAERHPNGASPGSHGEELRRRIAAVGRGRSAVLLQGESASDTEQAARALHAASERAARPFLAVSCSALTEAQLEAELFGPAEKDPAGSATLRGRIAQAAGGTLFLDEIGDVSAALQARLLRVLDAEMAPGRLDVRLIAASSADLEGAVNAGRFRRDLHERLGGFALHVPPLPIAELPYAEARRLMLRNFERRYFSTLLRRFAGNLTAAARAAGMDRSNFRRSLKASGLRSPGSQGDDPAREAAG